MPGVVLGLGNREKKGTAHDHDWHHQTAVTASLLTLTIGSIDAGISGDWDLFVIFLIAIGLSLTLLIRLESRRPAIPIRRDLVAWLEDRASVSGESIASVTDRAVATFADRYGNVIDPEDAQQ